MSHTTRRNSWMRLLCAVIIAPLAGACTHSVTIIQPLDGSYADPVTPLTVKFDKDFKPGTFQASLSGTTITNMFQPTPAPGGTSTAAPEFPFFMDGQYNGNQQRLVVDAEFTTPTSGPGNRITRDSSTFSPPIVRIFRGRTSTDTDLSLHERESITASAYVDKAPKERLLVTITGNSLVSLNDQPAGQSIQVWIPPNDRRADFTIRGIQVSGEIFRIYGVSTGFSSNPGGGTVSSAQ